MPKITEKLVNEVESSLTGAGVEVVEILAQDGFGYASDFDGRCLRSAFRLKCIKKLRNGTLVLTALGKRVAEKIREP